ncbi:MAG: hypothetical protein CXT73_00225 [Methanobacteriota archaeon]|jgi:hypothetical protein|nr:MAG: hypothetical protein CXT73_00225 [Euryarchaeota archaeon]
MTVEKVDPEKWKGIVQRMKDKERKTMTTDKNVENVISQLRTREQQGMIKYGVNTERTDLSTLEWLQHLQEELMDASVYIERLKNDLYSLSVLSDKPHHFDNNIQYHGKTKNYKTQPEND